MVTGRVEALERANGEGASLAGTGLRLCNCVFALDDRQDSLLLDGGRILETEGVDATQDFFLQPHVVKTINFLIPVRFETFFSFLSFSFVLLSALVFFIISSHGAGRRLVLLLVFLLSRVLVSTRKGERGETNDAFGHDKGPPEQCGDHGRQSRDLPALT